MGKLLIASMLALVLIGCDTQEEKKSNNMPAQPTPPSQQKKLDVPPPLTIPTVPVPPLPHPTQPPQQ